MLIKTTGERILVWQKAMKRWKTEQQLNYMLIVSVINSAVAQPARQFSPTNQSIEISRENLRKIFRPVLHGNSKFDHLAELSKKQLASFANVSVNVISYILDSSCSQFILVSKRKVQTSLSPWHGCMVVLCLLSI